MIALTFRIDVIEQKPSKDELEKYFSKYDKYLCYFELADKTKKPHYQGIVWVDDEKAKVAAKTRWTNVYGTTHPRDKKSMSNVDKETYEIYITKDKNCQFFKGYTEEDIKLLESKSYSKKERKITQTVYSLFLEYVKSKKVNIVKPEGTFAMQKFEDDICFMLLDWYRLEKRPEPGDFQKANIVYSVVKQLYYELDMITYDNYLRTRVCDVMRRRT